MNATEICNMALSYIARGRINSMDEESVEAKQCKIHYEHCRRRLLLAYPFGFASREVKLALLEPERYGVPGWRYVYSYPADTVAVRFVYDEQHAKEKEMRRQDFEVASSGGYERIIATDVKDAWATVTMDVKEPAFFSEEFIEALAHMLAAQVAMTLTGSASIMQTQLQLAQMAMESAAFQSVLEKERSTRYPDRYAEARFR